tara:strand:- start:594 stop:1718 length:1125 start_codon:yes stop_codon:yes gene_type:complete
MFQKIFRTIKNYINFFKLDDSKKKIIFYSENEFYTIHFLSLIEILTINKFEVTFLTSSEKDDLFKNKKLVNYFYIGDGFLKVMLLCIIKCELFLTTLTDIGHNIRKSNFCKKYIYIFHGPTSVHQLFKPHAFNNYDVIFCNGPYQIKELRHLEKKYNLKKKMLFNVGYPYLDYLIKKSNQTIKKPSKVILFAPTWNYNKNNLFDKKGFEIIEKLIKQNFKVILRPHPEHYKRSMNVINKINFEFKGEKRFVLDKNSIALKSMEESELLITDNSAITIEFLFIFFRPIIYINFQRKIHNKNFFDIPITPIEEKIKNLFGYELKPDQINFFEEHVKKAKLKISNKSKITQFRNKNFSNIGNVSESSFDLIKQLLKK